MPTSSFLDIFVFSFLVGFGAVVSPGPVSTAIVSQSPRRGWQVGPLVATGHAFAELLMALLIALGLTTVLTNPTIQTLIALLGGLLLIWMGAVMALDVLRGRTHLPRPDQHSQTASRWELVGLGVITTFSNPFWYAWWVTVAAGYLAQGSQEIGLSAVTAFYFGHISADFAWDTTLSAVVGSGRRWITDRIFRGIILICSIFFIYLGVDFLLQGITSLL